MANSTTHLDIISSSQAQKEVTANELMDALSPPSLFGRRALTSVALTWGFYGGTLLVRGAPVQIANGTLAALVPNRSNIQVQAGLVAATGVGISAVTRANPCVVTTVSTHDFAIGDVVFLDAAIGGMLELRQTFARVTATTSTTVTLNINTSTGFTLYTSGGNVRRAADVAGAAMQVGRGFDIANALVAPWPLYTLTTGPSSVTAYTDLRALQGAGGVLSRSVAGAANVVLTSDEARNGVIVLTGALTGSIAVILPPTAGHWWFFNATTGPHTITLRTPVGAGVVIPAGGNLPVVGDGSAIRVALTALPSAVTLGDGAHLVLGSATGTQIGTATSQRLGLWGVTPTVQPAGADQALVTLGNVDGAIGGLVISNPPTQAEVTALRNACETLADDVRALSTLIHALRAAGIALGAWRGSL